MTGNCYMFMVGALALGLVIGLFCGSSIPRIPR